MIPVLAGGIVASILNMILPEDTVDDVRDDDTESPDLEDQKISASNEKMLDA